MPRKAATKRAPKRKGIQVFNGTAAIGGDVSLRLEAIRLACAVPPTTSYPGHQGGVQTLGGNWGQTASYGTYPQTPEQVADRAKKYLEFLRAA